jgi:methylmalonyl-CoA/ethylmalonyl-CoA epimerase
MLPEELGINHISHVCIIVRDIQASMEMYWKTMGIGPWKIRTSSSPPYKGYYRGQPCTYSVRIAMAQAGPVTLELAQPLEGVSIYSDFLAEHGEGIHHFGIYVPDLEEALVPFKKLGVGALMGADATGQKGDGRFVYLDTEPLMGAIMELVQRPSVRGGEEETYP